MEEMILEEELDVRPNDMVDEICVIDGRGHALTLEVQDDPDEETEEPIDVEYD